VKIPTIEKEQAAEPDAGALLKDKGPKSSS